MNTMIWVDGTRTTLTDSDVYGLSFDEETEIRLVKSHGNHAQWEVTTPNYTFMVTTPRRADSFDYLFAASNR